MKIKLTLQKEYYIDLNEDPDMMETLEERAKSEMDEGEGEDINSYLDDKDWITDTIHALLDDDIEYVIPNLDIDPSDFKIEITR